jgi:penicillin-binding protein-related factor A (putative recombinase)
MSKSKTSEGKSFEKDWEDSYVKTGYFYLRLVDGVKWGAGEGSKFTPSNKCDGIQHTPPYLWMLEQKSTKANSISFHPGTPWENPKDSDTKYVIKPSQVKALKKEFEKGNPYVLPGLVLNFRERVMKTKTVPHQTYFVHIKDFLDYATTSGTSSISAEVCKDIGVTIEGAVKISHYRYNIVFFVEQAVRVYSEKGYIKEEVLLK